MSRAAAQRLAAEQARKKAEAEKARRARLDILKRRGAAAWQDVEMEIERRNPAGYETAAGLLSDLEELAAEQGTLAEFTRRIEAIRVKHGRKRTFIERLRGGA